MFKKLIEILLLIISIKGLCMIFDIYKFDNQITFLLGIFFATTYTHLNKIKRRKNDKRTTFKSN
jgi:hypothetical protein